MKKPVKKQGIKKSVYVILTIVGIILFIIAVYLFRDFTRETILIPFMNALYTFRFYIESFSQRLLWAIFIIISIFTALNSFWGSIRFGEKSRKEVPPEPSRFLKLSHWVRFSSPGNYHDWLLANHLGKLMLKTFGYKKIPGSDPVRFLEDPNIKIPSFIREFFVKGLSSYEGASVSSRWKKRIFFMKRNRETDHDMLEAAIRYLENKMEDKV